MTNRFPRRTLVTFLAAIALLPNVALAQRIVPLRTSATFSARALENRWSVKIRSPNGNAVYVLSLEPDFDVGRHVVLLELVLRRSDAKADAANLLDPTGKRHGLQAYDFAADDLAQGSQKSAFGERRRVYLKKLGLEVNITVSKARVSPILGSSDHQIDALELQIEANN